LQFLNSFFEHIKFAKKLWKKAACHFQNQKTQVLDYYLLSSKLNLAHKNSFSSYSSSKTHTTVLLTTRKQSQLLNQDNKNTCSQGGEK